MPGGSGTSYEYIHSFKNRMNDPSNRFGCLMPFALVLVAVIIFLAIKVPWALLIVLVLLGVAAYIVFKRRRRD